MAVASGTATDYLDLLDKLNTFLTTGLGSRNWTKLKDSVETGCDRNLYYQAPGLAGADTIFVNTHARHDAGADIYNIGMSGATGYNAAMPFSVQPGSSLFTYMLGWNTAIPYWFIGSGRVCKIIAKISGVYQSAYMGFLIPHGSPSEWQYPLFVGAMTSDPTFRWSSVSPQYKAFWNPAVSQNINPVQGQGSGAYMCAPGRSWIAFGNYDTGQEASGPTTGSLIWPYGTQFEQVGPIFGMTDEYTLTPLTLHSTDLGGANWGEFDGVYFISGYNNAVENIVTIGGVDYLVVQNAFRSSGPVLSTTYSNHYAAFKLA